MVEDKNISEYNTDVEQDASTLNDLSHAQKDWHYSHRWSRKLLQWGLETRGAPALAVLFL